MTGFNPAPDCVPDHKNHKVAASQCLASCGIDADGAIGVANPFAPDRL